jgi:hypothetical protein
MGISGRGRNDWFVVHRAVVSRFHGRVQVELFSRRMQDTSTAPIVLTGEKPAVVSMLERILKEIEVAEELDSQMLAIPSGVPGGKELERMGNQIRIIRFEGGKNGKQEPDES